MELPWGVDIQFVPHIMPGLLDAPAFIRAVADAQLGHRKASGHTPFSLRTSHPIELNAEQVADAIRARVPLWVTALDTGSPTLAAQCGSLREGLNLNGTVRADALFTWGAHPLTPSSGHVLLVQCEGTSTHHGFTLRHGDALYLPPLRWKGPEASERSLLVAFQLRPRLLLDAAWDALEARLVGQAEWRESLPPRNAESFVEERLKALQLLLTQSK